MSKEKHRKLAAILFTDIVGYTAMMQVDEQSAIKAVEQHQKVVEKYISEFGGELLHYYGDGSLSTFPSAFSAIKAAISIQQQLRKSPKVPLRIGVHIGEISFENGKVFGDGVNIASRIESLGQSGTVLFSRHVYEKIRNKSEFQCTSLGSYSFKNVENPIEVFALSNTGFPVPKRNTITGKLESTRPNLFRINWKTISGLTIASFLILLLGIKLGQVINQDKGSSLVKRFQILLPEKKPLDIIGSIPTGVTPVKALDVSPNGSKVVYVGKQNGINYLFLRQIANWETNKLFGTEGAYGPFISPDGAWIGFFADKKMKKIAVSDPNRQPITLCEVSLPSSAVWSENGTIYFCNNESGTLSKVSENGGIVEVIIHQDEQEALASFNWVALLPNDQMLLASDEDDFIAAIDIETKRIELLPFRGGNSKFLSSGHLVYMRLGQLFAVRFDPNKLKQLSSPKLIASQIATSTSGKSQITFSQDGTCFFVPGPYDKTAKLIQINRNGERHELPFPVDNFGTFQLSPNGQYLAIEVTKTHKDEIWIYDMQQFTTTKLISNGDNFGMAWNSASTEVSYMSKRNGIYGLYKKRIDGSTAEELIIRGKYRPYSYHPEEAWLSIGGNLFLNLADSLEMIYSKSSKVSFGMPMFSPNGKWFSYTSDESGQYEVYVKDFPPSGKRFQVSVRGGEEGLWSRDGKELFYRNGDVWMVLSVSMEGEFEFGKPDTLFSGPFINVGGHSYEASLDGESFIVLEATDTTSLFNEIRIIENMTNEFN